MSVARCEIEFLALPVNGEAVAVNFGTIGSPSPTIIYESARVSRGGSNQFSISTTPPPNDLVVQAGLLADAVTWDYTPGGLVASLPITVTTQTVPARTIIYAEDYGYEFAIPGSPPAWINITIFPEVPPVEELEIDDVTITEASVNPCDNVRYDFTVLNETYPFNITSPVAKTVSAVGDQFFEFARVQNPAQFLTLDDGVAQPSVELQDVSTFSISSVDVIESSQGATATINTANDYTGDVNLTYTYSIGDDYQVGNVFYSLSPGVYTAYAQDNYGCIKTQEFTVIGVIIDKPGPSFSIEEGNSLMFYKSTVFVPCGDERPSFMNSPLADQLYFNCEANYYSQLVQRCDNTTVQIRSNYETNTVSIVDCEGEEVATPLVNEEITNILLKDKRDCQVKAGSEGKTNIYYISGNTYDPDTLDINGEYSIDTGRLPKFANDGNIEDGITVELSSASLTGAFIVEAAVYDSEIEAYCLQINGNFSGTDGEAGITQATYNDEVYNIWEFVIDWNSLPAGHYRVIVSATDTDPRYDDVTWQSEWISSLDIQQDHTVIEYTSDRNVTNINYTTGIVFKLRVPARFIQWRNGGDSENLVSDDGTRRQLHGIVADEVLLEVDPVPQYVLKKIELAGINSLLKINNVTSVAVEKGESEGLMEEQNRFYKYTAWFQFGEPVVISSGSGLVSGSERVLGVNANILGI